MSQPVGEFEVERMRWSMEGGADEASLRCRGTARGDELENLLRCGVVIFNSLGTPVWWGFVNAVRYLKKGYEERVSLDEMWNRIAVKLESDGLFDEEYTSDWASDERSVDEFGIKEKLIIQRKNSEDLEAEAIRDRALAQIARPAKAVRWQERGKDEGVVLECKGWCHSLDWRYRQDKSGYIANDVVMTTTQYIGYTLYIKKAAQAFVTVGGINLKRVQLRIRREAIPTDNVLVSIQGDSGGNPSGSKLAEWTLPYSTFEDEGFKWINFDLEDPVALNGETKYWIVVERSGVYNDGWYYVWGADESSNYMNDSFQDIWLELVSAQGQCAFQDHRYPGNDRADRGGI